MPRSRPAAAAVGPGRARISRRATLIAVVSCAWGSLSAAPSVWAAETSVPAELQARLLAKLGDYDRSFEKRAGGTVRILLATLPDSGKAKLAVANMEAALAKVDRIGGIPHEAKVVRYESAAALAAQIRKEAVSIVYVPPGFDDEVAKLRSALSGVNVLSVTPVPSYVERGIVLGFELVSGKPRLMLNLTQAKQQNVDFKASALKLMKVYR